MTLSKKTAAAALPVLLASLIAMATAAAADRLLAPYPVPDDELASLVINPEFPQQTRMDTVSRVAEQANDQNMDARLAWLAAVAEKDEAPAVMRGHALDMLLALERIPAGFLSRIVRSVEDAGNDADWKISAIARLGSFHAFAETPERAVIADALLRIARDEPERAGAAALPTLARLAAENGQWRSELSDLIVARLSPENSEETLLSAIQSASLLRLDSVVASLRLLAANPHGGLRSRMAAIGGLGEMGSANDLEFLSGFMNEDAMLRKVAATAAARIGDRLVP